MKVRLARSGVRSTGKHTDDRLWNAFGFELPATPAETEFVGVALE